jgi:hypothetical protein
MRPVVFGLSCLTGLVVVVSSATGCGDWGAPLAGRVQPKPTPGGSDAVVGASAPLAPQRGADVSDAGAEQPVATAGFDGSDPGQAAARATSAPGKRASAPDASVAPPRGADGDAGLSPECVVDDDCPEHVCESGSCRPARCDDGRRNGTETDVDCGGSCTPCSAGSVCRADSDCSENACQDAHCCGGELVDCTRCARRLAGTNKCALSGDAGPACDAFLQCLSDHPDVCPRRLASGCSNETGAVCSVQSFGGNGSPAIQRADAILGTAGCKF